MKSGSSADIASGGQSGDALAQISWYQRSRPWVQSMSPPVRLTTTTVLTSGHCRNADTALRQCPEVRTVVVVKRTGGDIDWTQGRDLWYHEICAKASPDCPPEAMSAEDPLFILYTSGSTGKPKGVLHTTGGYLVYTAMTHEYVFD